MVVSMSMVQMYDSYKLCIILVDCFLTQPPSINFICITIMYTIHILWNSGEAKINIEAMNLEMK